MNNPLLSFDELPHFDRISPAHVAPAIDELLTHANAALQAVTADAFPAQWGEIARVLDVSLEKLGRAWGVVSHLNSVVDTPELRAITPDWRGRVADYEAFRQDDLRETMRNLGIHAIGYRTIRDLIRNN